MQNVETSMNELLAEIESSSVKIVNVMNILTFNQGIFKVFVLYL